jgi:RHS repeat-associated protein
MAVPLPQVLTARQGGTVSKYLRGLGLIGEQTGGAGPNAAPAVWQYHLPDALGSVRQLTDPTGQLLTTQRFDPFGGLMQRTTDNGPLTTYGFAGEEQADSGHLYLRARTYNPQTGRFLQQDPVLGTPNQPRTLHNYAYSFNNPLC